MGCTSSCDTDESSASCPFGSVTIKHCGFSCKKAVKEPEPKTPEEMAETANRMEYALWMGQQRKDGAKAGIFHPKDKKQD